MDLNMKPSPTTVLHSSGLLADLAPPMEIFTYRERQQFIDIFNSQFNLSTQDQTNNACEFILFNINEQAFAHDFLHASDSFFSKSWATYSASENLLLIKMMGPEHSAALVAFQEVLSAAVEPTGLKWAIQGFSGKTIEGTNKSKQGDGGWAPKRPPRDRSKKCPAVVLEVAVSETHSKLLSL